MSKSTGLFVLEVKSKGKPPKITADILPSERPKWHPKVQEHLDNALIEALNMYDKRKHSLDYFKMLLLAGASPNAKDIHGNRRPLHHAVRTGNYMLCKLLLENGANPNFKDTTGSTSLDSATYYLNTKICALLLGYGADVNIKNENGDTPLDRAMDNRDTETVKLLKAAKRKKVETI